MKRHLTIHTTFPLTDEQAAFAVQMLQAILDNDAKRQNHYADCLDAAGVVVTIAGNSDSETAECHLNKPTVEA